MDSVRQFILDRVGAIGSNLKAASLAIGRNQAYLHQFINKGSPVELGERDRKKLAIVLGVDENLLRGGASDLDSMDVAHLAIRAEHLDSQQVASGITRAPLPPPPETEPLPDGDLSFDLSDSHDLPLYASVEGGPGEMVVSSDPIGWLSRPRWLDGRDEAYAVRVVGTSMVPRYEPGEVVYVDPREPLERDKDAIFVNDAEGGFRASIKRLVRWEHHQWYIRQFNPPREGWWPKKRWPKAFRVMGRRD